MYEQSNMNSAFHGMKASSLWQKTRKDAWVGKKREGAKNQLGRVDSHENCFIVYWHSSAAKHCRADPRVLREAAVCSRSSEDRADLPFTSTMTSPTCMVHALCLPQTLQRRRCKGQELKKKQSTRNTASALVSDLSLWKHHETPLEHVTWLSSRAKARQPAEAASLQVSHT